MREKIHWGILGPGNIAHKFAQDIRHVARAHLVAVGSRDLQRAQNFAQKYNIPKFYGSYRALAEDPEIDILYIATPHGRHYEDIKLCLEHGKHVLCEKSFTLNARQAKEVMALAKARGLFLMEAMWTRFLPIMAELKAMLQKNLIGDLRLLNADLGFHFDFDAQSRLFNPQLGGGALLDVGVYPISLSQWILGKPQNIVSLAVLGQTGVDEQEGMVFSYANEVIANIFTSVRSTTTSQAVFMGTRGYIILEAPLYCPSGLLIKENNGKTTHIKAHLEGNGFQYEISEATQCVLNGKPQSDRMPWNDTIEVLHIMDALRAQWNFYYPQEKKTME